MISPRCCACARPSRSRHTSRFDKACAARSGRLHEPELVEEFGLSDACGGAGGARSVAPATPCTPRLPVGHTRRRCAPSPSLSKPISTPLRPRSRPYQEAGGAHRLQPTASYSPRCVCHRRAVCPPARAQTSNRLAGRTGGPRLARPHPQPRNRAAQGKGQGECVDRGKAERRL